MQERVEKEVNKEMIESGEVKVTYNQIGNNQVCNWNLANRVFLSNI